MPCMFWYTPSEESKRLIKTDCQIIIYEIKRLEKEADPKGISIRSTQELLRYLYNPEEFEEKGKK